MQVSLRELWPAFNFSRSNVPHDSQHNGSHELLEKESLTAQEARNFIENAAEKISVPSGGLGRLKPTPRAVKKG